MPFSQTLQVVDSSFKTRISKFRVTTRHSKDTLYFLTKCWQLPISYSLLCLDQTLVRLHFFPYRPLNPVCPKSEQACTENWNMVPLSAFPGNQLTIARPFSCQIPLLIQLPLKRFSLSLLLFLYLIKEKPFSVWFLNACRFLRSECFPYCTRFSF